MIKIIGPNNRIAKGTKYINTTSMSNDFGKELSPFLLGPVKLYGNYISQTVENAWQYSKVYKEFVDENGNPTSEYFVWAEKGWNNLKSERYPMPKGTKPLYSFWNGEHLNYIEARKKIYIPLYASCVIKTKAFKKLQEMKNNGEDILLWDFDGYDHKSAGMSYKEVVNNINKPMSHAFIIAMLLE